ncbi:MAG: alpha/beta hydrolase [Gemmatimonadales bacterium]
MMAMLLTIVGVLLALLALFVGLAWAFQERIVFQPTGPPFPSTDHLRKVTYLADDGQPLLAFIVGDPASAKGLLLCLHGNADLAARQTDWAENVVRTTGFAVMLAEYRGYMGLGGHPTYESSHLDSEAAFIFARDSLNISPKRIAFYGHSLGTAIAAELAARHRPLALILESPFTSARAMGRIIGWRPVELAWDVITRFHFDTVVRVASLDAPVWVAHGTKDRLIPCEMGKEVFDAAKMKGQLLLVPGALHSDVAMTGAEKYWRWMQSALQQSALQE